MNTIAITAQQLEEHAPGRWVSVMNGCIRYAAECISVRIVDGQYVVDWKKIKRLIGDEFVEDPNPPKDWRMPGSSTLSVNRRTDIISICEGESEVWLYQSPEELKRIHDLES